MGGGFLDHPEWLGAVEEGPLHGPVPVSDAEEVVPGAGQVELAPVGAVHEQAVAPGIEEKGDRKVGGVGAPGKGVEPAFSDDLPEIVTEAHGAFLGPDRHPAPPLVGGVVLLAEAEEPVFRAGTEPEGEAVDLGPVQRKAAAPDGTRSHELEPHAQFGRGLRLGGQVDLDEIVPGIHGHGQRRVAPRPGPSRKEVPHAGHGSGPLPAHRLAAGRRDVGPGSGGLRALQQGAAPGVYDGEVEGDAVDLERYVRAGKLEQGSFMLSAGEDVFSCHGLSILRRRYI